MKYFVTADPHGFTTILKRDLASAGFEPGNKGHKLIICGDIFDRGDEPVEMLDFLKSLKDQFIFIRGNHEDLLFDCVKEYRRNGSTGDVDHIHHISNGTIKTVVSLDEAKKLNEALLFIEMNAINYFETKNFIFVHGWLPETDYSKAGHDEWYQTRWKNGLKESINYNGDKTVVCGHWHCGWANLNLNHEDTSVYEGTVDPSYFEFLLSNHPYMGKNVIGLDACTVLTRKVNIFTFEE